MNKTLQNILKNLTLFYKFDWFPAIEKLVVIPHGSIPSFVRTEDILSPFELYNFFYQTDAHGLVCVQFSSELNSHLGGEKNIFKYAMRDFFQNLFLQVLNELDKTASINFDAINELNKNVKNILMDEANKFINQKDWRLSFNSLKDFKSENKKME